MLVSRDDCFATQNSLEPNGIYSIYIYLLLINLKNSNKKTDAESALRVAVERNVSTAMLELLMSLPFIDAAAVASDGQTALLACIRNNSVLNLRAMEILVKIARDSVEVIS